MPSRFVVSLAFLGTTFVACVGTSAEVTVERFDDRATVKIDGQLFTEYIVKSATKPILWPILGPSGERMTREYPMRDVEGETKDHPHQRSLWFTHGEVNGIDFWTDRPADQRGSIKHLEFLKTASGRPAVIVTRNAWLAPDGKKVCEDQRTLRFDTDGQARWIDFDVAVTATDGPVTFGDTKEGTFGLRVAETIRVDSKCGGHIVNSENQTDGEAWGRQALWVDYHGPVDGKMVGIAVCNHPSSFRYPTYWHVRMYGLFAANPFGVHEFIGGDSNRGEFTLPAGQSITFRYRVFIHCGDEKSGNVAESFAKYARED